jgi:hypothetical protein
MVYFHLLHKGMDLFGSVRGSHGRKSVIGKNFGAGGAGQRTLELGYQDIYGSPDIIDTEYCFGRT